MIPPFKPQVTSEIDTRYFDEQFTSEPVHLTPPHEFHEDPINEEPYFQSFSYHGSGRWGPASAMSTASYLELT